MSDPVRPHRQQPTRLPRPWDSPGKNTGVGCHFLLQCMKVKSEREVAQSCLTLGDPMDRSPPGSSVHGILQARALEWGVPSHVGHHRALSWVPCAVCMSSSFIYFIHSANSVYVSIPISPFIPPCFPPWYPYICSLHLYLYFCFANKIICTIFLDFAYTH